MSDYLVLLESYTQHSSKKEGLRLRPLKQIIDGKLCDFPPSDFQFETYVIWNNQQLKQNIFNDGPLYICKDFREHLSTPEDSDKTVINALDFVNNMETLSDYLYPYVQVYSYPNEEFLEPFRCGEIAFLDGIYQPEVYVKTEKKVYGPFLRKTHGQIDVDKSKSITCYDVSVEEKDLEKVHFIVDQKINDFCLIKKSVLSESQTSKIDLIKDAELLHIFTSQTENFYSKSKGKDEITSLKNIAKKLQSQGIKPDFLSRIQYLISSTEELIKLGRTVIIDNFTNLSNNVKDQLFEELVKNQNACSLFYNYAKNRKDYKGKIEKIIAQYGEDDQIQSLKETIQKLKEQIQLFKKDPPKQVSVKPISREPSEDEIRLQKQIKERENTYYNLLPKIFTGVDTENFKPMFELIRQKSSIIVAQKKLTEIFESIQEKNSQIESEIALLEKDLSLKQNKLNALTQTLQDKKTQLAQCENEYIEILPQYIEKLTFDSVLSTRILKATEKFGDQQSTKKVSETIPILTKNNMIATNYMEYNARDLVSKIQRILSQQLHRQMSYNDTANLILCISQGFLTVLAGEPGTGKTSLVNALAEILGYTNPDCKRFTEVAVEKGWSSRRDLIGYYNPLTKSFDASNGGLYSALISLNQEQKLGVEDFPYWVLLDEANLSQMEHYWADFMGLCDMNKKQRQVSLSAEHVFNIPKTLRFLATINLDYTTERLSPRLVDRAWIIRLQATQSDFCYVEDVDIDQQRSVCYSVFKSLCSSITCNPTKISQTVKMRLKDIRELFISRIKVILSPRVMNMVTMYCAAASDLMEIKENAFVALDYAVAQKILPNINGFGEDYCTFLEELIKLCPQEEMPISNEILQEIKDRGNMNMQSYQYFLVRN